MDRIFFAADCDWLARFLYRFCDGDNVTLATDPVSFVNSTSSVFTQTNFMDINVTMFYYKLCLFYPNWDIFDGRNVLINCTQNETELDLEVKWDTPGWLNLSVAVYREEDMEFLGCAKTSITIAGEWPSMCLCCVHCAGTGTAIMSAIVPVSPVFSPAYLRDIGPISLHHSFYFDVGLGWSQWL